MNIESLGAYAPRYRLQSEAVSEAWGQFQAAGISTTAVPDADEDALTMASEAATRALATTDVNPESIVALTVGTTTPPAEEGDMVATLASTLGLSSDVQTRLHEGSTRAGVDALATAIGAASGPRLVIGSDAPRGSPDDAIGQAAGAGAAAVVLTTDGPGTVAELAEHVTPFPGTRFRRPGSTETEGLGVTTYDRRAFRETVGAAAAALDDDVSTAEAIAIQSPDGSLPYRAAGTLGAEDEQIQRGTTVHKLGDTGAASPLLGLASAADNGHTDVAVIGYGGGGATAMRIDATDVSVRTGIDGHTELSYAEALRMRGEITSGEPEGGGAYVSVPSWKRTIPQRHRLVAGRCRPCSDLAFPPTGVCSSCGTFEDYESVVLPGTGTVEAATVIGQGGAPPEFVEQQARSGSYVSAIVALDGPDGGAVSVPAQVIRGERETVDPGDPVEATIRRIYTQEGLTRYGVKMRPVEV